MRIAYFGSAGPLSVLPLQAVLAAAHDVCVVIQDTPLSGPLGNVRLPVVIENDESVGTVATQRDIPLIGWEASSATNLEAVRRARPDLVLVSCFSKKLPDGLLALPRLGAFNLHPSRLPAYRGPVPVFWQFRDGLREFGVTLHRLSARLDAGPIIAQTAVTMPDGVDAYQADQLLAQAAGELLIPALQRLARGAGQETPQDEARASCQGFPSARDYRVSAAWPARRVYNFIRATGGHGCSYTCEVDGRTYYLAGAESYQPAGNAPFGVRDDEIVIPCSPGTVRARLCAAAEKNPRPGRGNKDGDPLY